MPGDGAAVRLVSMKEALQYLKRLERILKVRQMAVDAAEGRIRECEFQIQRLESRGDSEQGKIRQTMEEFAHANGISGRHLQCSDKAIEVGNVYLARILQDIEKLRSKLDKCRAVWREARREYKTVEKLQERQLQKLSREEAVLTQKMIDEVSVIRHSRKTGI